MRAKHVLDRVGVVPSKQRGQNFLIDESFPDRVVEFAEIGAADHVLEIGGGLGALTEAVLRRSDDLTVVEIEPKLCAYLREQYPQLEERVRCADIRDVALADLAKKPGEKFVVVGNIPYSISSDVVFWLIEQRASVRHACFLFQKEFSERVAAPPGGRDYGIISVMVKLYASTELGAIIDGSAFHPPAAVDSQLVRFSFSDHPLAAGLDHAKVRAVVAASFGQRRKTLLNSLSGSQLFESKAQTLDCLNAAGIDPGRRAETLSLEEYLRLAEAYHRKSA
ncbi:MAG: ribosomal RNA small subunit methyltransferase A [Deltaproteobacteria bacterium]|nr:ribosomal RNA small subunit methyltransferase A [Deltaproteobacteria bacterium]